MSSSFRRIDLHCHSDASNKTSEALLNAIHCPESYSRPHEVYEQAKRRGMDFVTLTDHDTIDGAMQIADRPDVLVGEELSCWFPEDHCKLHLLVYGIGHAEHDDLQSRARDIYAIAEYIEARKIAHAVAHPIYRQNDKLERWHLERLLLLFKGFECLNGAHSALHREAFEPLLDRLDPDEMKRMSDTHALQSRWPRPWLKSRIGGSDDHGLLNVGRTWTEFPADTETPADILFCLREGLAMPGGEAGSSTKLAHTFFSVAVRYYTQHIMSPGAKPNVATGILQTFAGARPAPGKFKLAAATIKKKVRNAARRIVAPIARSPRDSSEGTAVLKRLFLNSAKNHLRDFPELLNAACNGLPPLGEHEKMFEFVNSINRDVTEGIAAAITSSIDAASFTGLFDSIAAILGQQFVILPYYFALFHQNKERNLLRNITGIKTPLDAKTIRVGLFTDTLDEINGVGRFIRDIGSRAKQDGLNLKLHTCGVATRMSAALDRTNFIPLLSRPMPCYSELSLNLPPVLEILEWADRQQFDAIHVSTPGPMGLCGWLVSKMLRIPMVATYHTDFPAYVDKLTGDHRITNGTSAYMKWFYAQASAVFVRSAAYRFKLLDMGIPESKLRVLPAGVDVGRFNASYRNNKCFDEIGVAQPRRLLYAGRVSVEKNLPLLATIFRMLCGRRKDVALIIAGDGPYLNEMKQALTDLPAHFVGVQNDAQLAALYASSDLFIFPSRTDTLGQVVMEAQASGLPAIVSTEGGPKETVVDHQTGRVLSSNNAHDWADAISALLDDEPRRQQMSQAAVHRASRFSLARTFDTFWSEHLLAAVPKQPPGRTPPVVIDISAGLDRPASRTQRV